MKVSGQEADPKDAVKPFHAFVVAAAAFGLSGLLRNERYAATAQATGIALVIGGAAMALINHSQRAAEATHAKELAHLPKAG